MGQAYSPASPHDSAARSRSTIRPRAKAPVPRRRRNRALSSTVEPAHPVGWIMTTEPYGPFAAAASAYQTACHLPIAARRCYAGRSMTGRPEVTMLWSHLPASIPDSWDSLDWVVPLESNEFNAGRLPIFPRVRSWRRTSWRCAGLVTFGPARRSPDPQAVEPCGRSSSV